MTNNQETSTNELYVPAILAILFVLVAAVLVWATQIRPATSQAAPEQVAVVAGSNDVASAAAPAESQAPADMDAVIAAITKGGCVACHTIPDIPDAIGQVGPNLSNIGVDAASRREGYTAEEYIRESLSEPNAFIVPDCPFGPCVAGTMPNLPLDESEIELLVSFLSTLGK